MRLLKLLERIISAIPVAIGVAVIAFLFLRFLPGDPVEIMLGDTQVTQQQIDGLRNQLHLDEPLYRQLGLFLVGLLQGDFGTSFVKNQPVVKLIAGTLPATIELTIASILFALIMVWMRRWDRTVMIALIAIAVVGVIYLAVRVSTNSGVVS